MQIRSILIAATLVLASAPAFSSAASGDLASVARGNLENELRAVQSEHGRLAQQGEQNGKVESGVFDREKLERARHGLFSLVLPGWSQYRGGHNGRAVAFASTEAVIWGTWIFSRLQGSYREDRYEEFATQFAGIRDPGSKNDDYWRAVGRYGDVEEYNNNIRRDNRAAALEQEFNGEPVTIGLNDGTIAPEDGWSWSSEARQTEFRAKRADSESAYDRAGFVLLFALVNRVVSFADAVRSGPRDDARAGTLIRAGGLELGLDVEPYPQDPRAALRLGARF